MTRHPIILAEALSALLLLQSAVIGAQGAERGGETTAVRAGEMASTASANSWIPAWFPKAPVMAPPTGAVIRVTTVEELLTAVDRVPPGGTILLAEGHYRLPRVMVLQHVNNLVHGEILLEGGEAHLRTNLTGRLDNYCVDPASGNLALTTAATRAIDQGVPLAEVTEDIRGQSRAQRPDLGAWEFEAPETSSANVPPVTSLGNTSVRYTIPEQGYVMLKRGDLEVVVVDNRAVDDAVLPGHRAGYHGIASLRHVKQLRNLFVPAYAGLNFEHIHDGTAKPRQVLFEPRYAPVQLRVLNDRTAELYQGPTPYWGLESCMRYELVDGEVLEMTFECVPRRETFTNGYLGLFWASYIDHPESLDIHFRGFDQGAGSEADWLRGVTPAHGSLATHRAHDDQREFPHEAAFPLGLPFGFSRSRYAEPWYFGVCRGMAFVQMFRAHDGVRLTQSPSGGGSGCPAWDFQWFIEKPRVGQRYQLVMRVGYVPVNGPGDAAQVREQIRRLVKERQPK